MQRNILAALTVTAAAALSACSMMPMNSASMKPYDQSALPAPVMAPAGNMVAMETVGVGNITYECRTKANMPSEYEWFFVGPEARLMDRQGKVVGRYFGPPATWANNDGSALTGAQVAVAPAMAGAIPYQLVKANPATGMGAMSGVTYIQRVATQGGVAPSMACGASNVGAKQVVAYQADYIFYKAR